MNLSADEEVDEYTLMVRRVRDGPGTWENQVWEYRLESSLDDDYELMEVVDHFYGHDRLEDIHPNLEVYLDVDGTEIQLPEVDMDEMPTDHNPRDERDGESVVGYVRSGEKRSDEVRLDLSLNDLFEGSYDDLLRQTRVPGES
jgi:hypothetical protein